MNAPRVSIVLATYNRPQFVGEAIQSARAQTFTDWEMLVICDSDSDGTAEVMKGWVEKDKRIRYIQIPRSGRIAVVSNRALREAKGEYVAILDDDDTWNDSEKLAKQVAFLDTHTDYVGVGGGFIMMNGAGKEIGRVRKPQDDRAIKQRALLANPMANATTMFRRDVAERIGWYDETMPQFADWDFWLKIRKEGKLYNFPEYFLNYRMWDQGSSFAKQRENAAAALRIVSRYKHEYPNAFFATCLAHIYSWYVRLPEGLKRYLNSALSRLKKILFAG